MKTIVCYINGVKKSIKVVMYLPAIPNTYVKSEGLYDIYEIYETGELLAIWRG